MPRYTGIIYIHRSGFWLVVDPLEVSAGSVLIYDLLNAINGEPVGSFSLGDDIPDFVSLSDTDLRLAPDRDAEPGSGDIEVVMAGITGIIPYIILVGGNFWGSGDGDFWDSGDGDFWGTGF